MAGGRGKSSKSQAQAIKWSRDILAPLSGSVAEGRDQSESNSGANVYPGFVEREVSQLKLIKQASYQNCNSIADQLK